MNSSVSANRHPTHDRVTPQDEPDKPLQRLVLELGRDHPFYEALRPEWLPYREPPTAWYVRVPDLPGFLRLIAPVLERRLRASAFAGYTGDLTLDFYRSGLRLRFDDGRLVTIEDSRYRVYEAMAGFPPPIFLRLVFGHSSLRELRDPYPDIWVTSEAQALLTTLFPKRMSRLVD